jgi:hypothetical protein
LPQTQPELSPIHLLEKASGYSTPTTVTFVPVAIRSAEPMEQDIANGALKVLIGADLVKIAPPPVALIPKSNVTEGLLAHIVVSKFVDGLPLYRQEKIFAHMGIELPRATMANWTIRAAQCCSPMIDLLQADLRSGPLISLSPDPAQGTFGHGYRLCTEELAKTGLVHHQWSSPAG